MQVAGRDKEELETELWGNFYDALRSPDAKDHYPKYLRAFIEFQGINPRSFNILFNRERKKPLDIDGKLFPVEDLKLSFCKEMALTKLVDKNQEAIESSIKNYLMDLRKRDVSSSVSSSYRRNHLAAIKKFYIQNDLETLHWIKLAGYLGEPTQEHEDRAYKLEEIATVYDSFDERGKVLVLLLSSTGLRIGAFHTMKVGHFHEIEDCYQIDAYRDTDGYGHYIIFCTPEARQKIEAYLNWRRRCGETITDDSPLLRKDFDSQDSNAPVLFTTRDGLRKDIELHLIRAGLRTVTKGVKNIKNRKEVKANHGFRKFFESGLRQAGIDLAIREKLRGKSKRDLNMRYNKPEIEELFSEYKKAIPYLTIDQTINLQKKVAEQKEDLNKIDLVRAEHKRQIDDLAELNRADRKSMEKKIQHLEHESLGLMKEMIQQTVRYQQTLGLAATDPKKFLQMVKDGSYAKMLEQELNPEEIEAQAAKILKKNRTR